MIESYIFWSVSSPFGFPCQHGQLECHQLKFRRLRLQALSTENETGRPIPMSDVKTNTGCPNRYLTEVGLT